MIISKHVIYRYGNAAATRLSTRARGLPIPAGPFAGWRLPSGGLERCRDQPNLLFVQFAAAELVEYKAHREI